MSDQARNNKSLEKAVAILEHLARNPSGCRLADMVSHTGQSRSTCHRFLTSLSKLNLVEKTADKKTYRIGSKLIGIGLSAYRELDFRRLAVPLLRKLRDETGETTNLTLLDGNEIVIADRFRSVHLMDMALDAGIRLPVYCTSTGKVILAHINETRRAKIISQLIFEPRTHKTIISKAAFLQHLREIRQKGYSVCDEELELGMYSIAAPILNYEGEALAAVNISFALVRHREPDRLAKFSEKIKTVAATVSRALGYQPPG